MSNQDLPPDVQQILREAIFWDWWLGKKRIGELEWILFVRWHAVPAHQDMLDAVYKARQRQAALAHTRTNTSSSWARPWAWALALPVIVFLALKVFDWSSTVPPYEVIETEIAGTARPLKDGTMLRAQSHTRIQVQYSRFQRSLSLSRGEAFFDVAHEPDRSFVVHTPDATIQARGTRFGVSIDSGVTTVTVTQGTVDVTKAPNTLEPMSLLTPPTELQAGEQARVSQTHAPLVSCIDTQAVLAWATIIEFDEVAAPDALKQFSERNGFPMTLKNPLAGRAVTIDGTFQLDEPMRFATYVADRTSSIVSVSGPGPIVTDVPPRIGITTRGD